MIYSYQLCAIIDNIALKVHELVCAELDAYYARLYGLTRDELRYAPYGVDPKEVRGEDFPGETFRVLKEKEVSKQLGEYGKSNVAVIDNTQS